MQVGSTWRKHRAVRVIKAKPQWIAASELGNETSFKWAGAHESKLGNERVSIGRFIAEAGKGPYLDME
jgi:hypothetical protein